MARRIRQTTGANTGRIELTATETVIGVELNREIGDGVKVRPTNVTAAMAPAPGADANVDYILLHNGPKGGFTQPFKGTAGFYNVGDVVRALITDA